MNKEWQTNGQEIAVIGMAGRFPDANNIRAYWENIAAGLESISVATDEELKNLGVDETLLADEKYIKVKGGLLEDWDKFDARFFGFAPFEAALMDPQTRLFLECAWSAVEDAGYSVDRLSHRVGVYAGAGSHHHWEIQALQSDSARRAGLLSAISLADKDFISSRVSHQLNFTGPSCNLQASCATSLVAVHTACQALLNGECDMALAGGVSIYSQPKPGYLDQGDSYFSSDGHLRAFDANASGTVSGEGVGVVVLKLLEDAQRDRNHIYAVVKGSAVNNDGHRKANYSAPAVEGQKRVIRQALSVAQVAPQSIGYVECHGTGTLLGDPIEVEALKQAFEGGEKGECALGSVKCNIGHLNGAAGIAGFIKAVLAVWHRQLPPLINYSSPNPAIDFSDSPFYVNTRLIPWESKSSPLRAGVSAFGIGGNNAHVIVEQAPPVPPDAATSKKVHILAVSAMTEDRLSSYSEALSRRLKEENGDRLGDIAYTFNSGRRHFRCRAFVTGRTSAEVSSQLAASAQRKHSILPEAAVDRPVVFIFSGQGSGYPEMGRGIYRSEPIFRRHLDKCFQLLEPLMGEDITPILYPPAGGDSSNEHINQPRYTGPIKFAFEYALARMLISWGIVPTAMIGHSLGEYVCACLSGVISLPDALALVVLRNRLMEGTREGAMLSVPLTEAEACDWLDDEVALAAVNTPHNAILSGSLERLDAVAAALKSGGIDSIRFNVARAGHSMFMDGILDEFERAVAAVSLSPPQIPYISDVSGDWISPQMATDPKYYARHIRSTVRFSDGLATLLDLDHAAFIQVGADRGPVVFVEQQPGFSSQHSALNLVRHRKNEISDEQHLAEALGRLWQSGVSLDWAAYYAPYAPRRCSLPTYPFKGDTFSLPQSDTQGEDASLLLTPLAGAVSQKSRLYVPLWRQQPSFRVNPSRSSENKVLLFMDTCGLGAYLSRQMRSRGNKVIEVHPQGRNASQSLNGRAIRMDVKEDYLDLIKEIKATHGGIDHIVHAAGFGTERRGKDFEKFEDLLDCGIYSVLFLVQALGYADAAGPIHLDVITNNMQEVIGGELTCPEKATLLGALNVIEAEYENIKCRCIDVDLNGSDDAAHCQLYGRILQEVDTPSKDGLVALRGRSRWLKTYEAVNLSAGQGASPIRPGGVYLIIGGLGRIGLAISRYLAQSAQVTIVMLQRSAVPARETWERYLGRSSKDDSMVEKIGRLMDLEAAGAEIETYSVDVADADRLEKTIATITQRHDRVNGVFHCAMDPGGGLIQGREKKEMDVVLAAKVKGTLLLDRLLSDQDLDFFVLFSSLSAVLPVVGKIDYCSANAFLDAFAHHPRQGLKTRYMAINWNYWEGTPLIDAPETAAIIRKNGVSQKEGIGILARLLEEPLPQVLVSRKHPADYAQALKETSLAHYAQTSVTVESVAESLQNYRRTVPYSAPGNERESILADIWQAFFGYSEIGVTDDFFQLGGDSLKALHIIPRINARLGGAVTIANFYRYPTIAEMAAYLASGATACYEVLSRLGTGGASFSRSVVCLPYAAGGSATYMEFAQAMGEIDPQAAVFAVNYPGNDPDDSCMEEKDFEGIVTRCVSRIKAEATTPLAIYGHCVGAYVALDLCARLEREDIKVDFVAIGAILNHTVVGIDEILAMDETHLREIYLKLGTFRGRDGEIPPSEYTRISNNFREDALRITRHKERCLSSEGRQLIRAPIINLISDTDASTPDYKDHVDKWKAYSEKVRLVEIKGGGHYFINEKAREVAEIVAGLMNKDGFRP